MEKKKIKVVDTNWYVSATINKNSRRTFFTLLSNKNIQVYYSQELLQEYEQVISRATFSKFISFQQVGRFIKLLLPELSPIKVSSKLRLSRDSKDDFILALAVDAGVDYLITSDFDLLVLQKVGKTKILNMSDFLNSGVLS